MWLLDEPTPGYRRSALSTYSTPGPAGDSILDSNGRGWFEFVGGPESAAMGGVVANEEVVFLGELAEAGGEAEFVWLGLKGEGGEQKKE